MGLFYRDTRLLSAWSWAVNDQPIEPLIRRIPKPSEVHFVGRHLPDASQSESTVLFEQRRCVGSGMHEQVKIRNLAGQRFDALLSLHLEADFADLFDVKAGRNRQSPQIPEQSETGWLWDRIFDEGSRGLNIVASGLPRMRGDRLLWQITLGPKAQLVISIEANPIVDRVMVPARHLSDGFDSVGNTIRISSAKPARQMLTTADPSFARTLQRSFDDISSLRVIDPAHPERAIVAAGAPWFMALFGRDSLLSAWMVLPYEHKLALGTLQTLAAYQGTNFDLHSEEEPGRILHEVRLGATTSSMVGQRNIYYGTADASALFVMLLGEASRWGANEEIIRSLIGNADRALEWIDRCSLNGPGGFLGYHQKSDHGLVNQGWKDSWNGINFANGEIAKAPIALCEVQGYIYAAYLARAHLAQRFGTKPESDSWLARASDLKKRFNEAFWIPEKGWYAVGLDRDMRQIDALASNMGHAMWTGIIDERRSASVAEVLASEDMTSGWGLRTLASSMGAYNPISYHNGSVWPHDTAIAVAGLARYGFNQEAAKLASALLESATHFHGRLPELFSGFARSEFAYPVPYPTPCSPQAWAAASPMLLLRSLLHAEPDVPNGRLFVNPTLPADLLPLSINNIAFGASHVSINVDQSGFEVLGVSPEIQVTR